MGEWSALFHKQLLYKLVHWPSVLIALIVPGLLLGIIAFSRIYFVALSALPNYDFTEPQYDWCPAFTYGTEFERILPDDNFISDFEWTHAGIYHDVEHINKVFGSTFPELRANNYPNGTTEFVCSYEFSNFFTYIDRDNTTSKAVKQLGVIMNQGWHALDIGVTYNSESVKDSKILSEIFRDWLEDFGHKSTLNLRGVSLDACGVTHHDGQELGQKLPCSDYFPESNHEIFMAMMLSHKSEKCFDDYISVSVVPEDSDNTWGHCVARSLSPVGVRTTDLDINELSGPGVNSKLAGVYQLHVKSDEAFETGRDPVNGASYSSELFNLTILGNGNIQHRPVIHTGLGDLNFLNGPLLAPLVRNDMKAPYVNNFQIPWSTNISNCRHGPMDFAAVLQAFEYDRKANENGVQMKNFYLSEMEKYGSTTLAVMMMSVWHDKTQIIEDRISRLTWRQVFFGGGEKPTDDVVIPAVKDRLMYRNTAWLSTICYGLQTDEKLPNMDITMKGLVEVIWLMIRWSMETNPPHAADISGIRDVDPAIRSVPSEELRLHLFEIREGIAKERQGLRKRINSWWKWTPVLWCELEDWRDCDSDDAPLPSFTDEDVALSCGYIYPNFKRLWDEFEANGMGGTVELIGLDGKTFTAEVGCDPQRISDLSQATIGLWWDVNDNYVRDLLRILNPSQLGNYETTEKSRVKGIGQREGLHGRVVGDAGELGSVHESYFPVLAGNRDLMAAMFYKVMFIFLVMTLAAVPLYSSAVRSFVSDRETNMFQYLPLLGIEGRVYWAVYYTFIICEVLLVSLFEALVIRATMFSGFLQWSAIFFVGNLNVVPFALLMSSFFLSAPSAILSGVIVFVVSVQVFAMTQNIASASPALYRSLVVLLPGFGASHLVRSSLGNCGWNPCAANTSNIDDLSDCRKVGLTWSSMANSLSLGSSIMQVLGLLLLSTIIYSLIAHYLIMVFPRDGSPALSPRFFFKKSYWKPKDESGVSTFSTSEEYEENLTSDSDLIFERPESDPLPILAMRKVTKRFASSMPGQKFFNAVDGVTFNVASDEVLVLLGHNGAGKTTLIKMLTGQLAMTSGEVTVDGKNISSRYDVRGTISYCPQFDTLFPYMTVRQHFSFVAEVKGIGDQDQIEAAVVLTANILSLTFKLDAVVKSLSGGQKRRVSIGMATIGDPRLIVLDEPSTGVDPATRRSMWDCIRRLKQRRGIILTTHFMDEADYLADRCVIMSEGKVKGDGTLAQLKSASNAAYTMTITMMTLDERKREDLISSVRDIVPELTVRNLIALELCFQFPSDAVNSLPDVIRVMDKAKEEETIKNYTIGVASIEDVFLAIGKQKDVDLGEIKNIGYDVFSHYDKFVRTGFGMKFVSQTGAIIQRRMFQSLASVREWFIAFVMPSVIYLFVGLCGLVIMQQAAAMEVTLSSNESYVSELMWDMKVMRVAYATAGLDKIPTFDSSIFEECLEMAGFKPTRFDSWDDMQTGLRQDSLETWLNDANMIPYVWGAYIFEHNMLYDGTITGEGLDFTAFHNSNIYHYSYPMAMITVQRCTGPYAVEDRSYNEFVYYPQNFAGQEKASISGIQSQTLGFMFVAALSLCCLVWMLNVITENNSNSKHLQLCNGVSLTWYWLGHGAYDFVTLIVGGHILLCTSWALGGELLSNENYYAATLLGMILFAIAELPRIYIIASFFKSQAKGITVQFLIGIMMSLMPAMLQALKRKEITPNLDLAFSILSPEYLFSMMVLELVVGINECPLEYGASGYNQVCRNVWDWNVDTYKYISHSTGWHVSFFVLQIFIIYPVFAIYETCCTHPYVRKAITKRLSVSYWTKKMMGAPEVAQHIATMSSPRMTVLGDERRRIALCEGNQTVLNERARIVARYGTVQEPVRDPNPEDNPEDGLLVLRGIRKLWPGYRRWFGGKRAEPDVAVDDTYFEIFAGSCFGFLGVNGAGKTTTVNILTGMISATSGDAFFNGIKIGTGQSKMYEQVSYCPQFNGLIETLSGRRLLTYYAKIAMISHDKVDEYVDDVITHLGIQAFADRPCGQYSGGNKRKLSVAIAFIGNPRIVFLDEPSSGVDPASRRKLWNLIIETVRSGNRCVVLTTHSMEECEALCSKLTIMKKGKMMCIGSPNEVRSSLGKCFMVEFVVANCAQTGCPLIEETMEQVRETFTSTTVLEVNGSRIRWTVDKNETALANLFQWLNDKAELLLYRDYSVSESTLESAFVALNGADEENEETSEPIEIQDQRLSSLISSEIINVKRKSSMMSSSSSEQTSSADGNSSDSSCIN